MFSPLIRWSVAALLAGGAWGTVSAQTITPCPVIFQQRGAHTVVLDDILVGPNEKKTEELVQYLEFRFNGIFPSLGLNSFVTLRCEKRYPNQISNITPDHLQNLYAHNVVLEFWGRVSTGEGKPAEVRITYLVVPVQFRAENPALGAPLSEQRFSSHEHVEELLKEMAGYALTGLAENQLANREYYAAQGNFIQARARLKKALQYPNATQKELLTYIEKECVRAFKDAQDDKTYQQNQKVVKTPSESDVRKACAL